MPQEFGFDEFRIRVEPPSLFRNGEQVPLRPKEFATLLALVEARGRFATTEELIAKIWNSASNMDDSNLRQQVRSLRRKLGKGLDYIPNTPGQGYRLAATVVSYPDEVEEAYPEAQHTEEIASSGPPQPPGKQRFRTLGFAALAAVAVLAGILSIARRLWPMEMELQTCRQITRDGRRKETPVSDGSLVYFTEFVGNKSVIASVPVTGGNVTWLDLPLASPSVVTLSPARHSIILFDYVTHQLYEAQIGSLAVRRMALPPGFDGSFAAWDPSGHRLAVAVEDGVLVFDPSIAARPLRLPFSSPSLAGWDPQGRRLRFEVYDEKSDSSRWWELSGNEPVARPLPPFSANLRETGGAWTGGGRFFVFVAGAREREQLWVADEQSASSKPFPLTVDARIWGNPAPLPGANTMLATARQAQGQLVALPGPGQAGGIKPVIPGLSAYELEYSRDGQWVTYTLFPEHTVWRARADGNDARQLTPSNLVAHQPHWSPDGTRIAFVGSADKRSRIYLVPSMGGALNEPLPDGDDQGVPTWSANGRSLIFGDVRMPAGFEHATIHELDLQTQAVSTIATPTAMWTPRIAPDGKHLVAVSYDNHSLYVRDNDRSTWQECATMAFLGEPVWSRDSSSIQFIAGRLRVERREALFRVSLACEPPRLIADLSTYEHAGAAWTGIGLDGSPLALLRTNEEVYALDWRLRRRTP